MATLIPDWEYVGYGLDFTSYHVDRHYEYPRFLCYDCHGFQPYYSWNPYAYSCTSFRVVIYNDPYYYPATRYRGTRVVYVQPRRGVAHFGFKDRARRRSRDSAGGGAEHSSRHPAGGRREREPKGGTPDGGSVGLQPRKHRGYSPRCRWSAPTGCRGWGEPPTECHGNRGFGSQPAVLRSTTQHEPVRCDNPYGNPYRPEGGSGVRDNPTACVGATPQRYRFIRYSSETDPTTADLGYPAVGEGHQAPGRGGNSDSSPRGGEKWRSHNHSQRSHGQKWELRGGHACYPYGQKWGGRHPKSADGDEWGGPDSKSADREERRDADSKHPHRSKWGGGPVKLPLSPRGLRLHPRSNPSGPRVGEGIWARRVPVGVG